MQLSELTEGVKRGEIGRKVKKRVGKSKQEGKDCKEMK